jgi:hypothetical protein
MRGNGCDSALVDSKFAHLCTCSSARHTLLMLIMLRATVTAVEFIPAYRPTQDQEPCTLLAATMQCITVPATACRRLQAIVYKQGVASSALQRLRTTQCVRAAAMLQYTVSHVLHGA